MTIDYSNSDGVSEAQDIDPNDYANLLNYDVRSIVGVVGLWAMDGLVAHEPHNEYNASRSDGDVEDYWFWTKSCTTLGPDMPVRRRRLRAGVGW